MSIKQNGGVFGRNPTFNDVTIEGDLIINGEVFTGLDFQGSWNASTNTPALASSTGTNGEFYIVSVAGSTDLNGITNWGIGDWAIFNGTAWQRVEGGADGNFNDLTVAGSLSLGDNVKANFGAGDDLQIYHDGNSKIEAVSGYLKLASNLSSTYVDGNNVHIRSGDGGETLARFNDDSDVKLYHDNSQKLATTATGIDVTGTATMDGLSVTGIDNLTGTLTLNGRNTGQILFQSGGATKMTMGTDGSLTVSGAVSGGGTYRAGNTGTGNIIIEGGQHIFRLGSGGSYAERARIDTSGSLLVGKTGTNISSTGIEAKADGQLWATRDGNPVLSLNRKTSDGSMVVFYKDGTAVGSIGVSSSNNLLIGSSATDHTGLIFPDNAILPAKELAATDAFVDLGTTSRRFKDLYLSGGVYLGGTGSANKLDDYEEGTWTGVSTATGTNSVGLEEYTKIGDTVHISFRVTFSGASGSLSVTGLPYSVANNAVGIGREDNTSGYAVYARIASNTNSLHFYYAGAIGNATPFQVASGQFLFNLTYKTDA